jgi:uncharacterized protein (TIGR02646 family)
MTTERARQIRAQLYEQQNGLCCYCNKQVTLESVDDPDSATIEHLKPKCMGGTNDIENLALACYKCNQDYGYVMQKKLRASLGKSKFNAWCRRNLNKARAM